MTSLEITLLVLFVAPCIWTARKMASRVVDHELDRMHYDAIQGEAQPIDVVRLIDEVRKLRRSML